MQKNRFILQRSSKADNRLICTDTENKIVCEFEFGRFNDTQKFTMLDDLTELQVEKMPTIMREFGDFLAQNHYFAAFAAMPYDEDECRIFVARMIRRERIKRGLSVYELSKRSGIQINHITRIEEGKFSPRIGTIIRLLSAMNLELTLL